MKSDKSQGRRKTRVSHGLLHKHTQARPTLKPAAPALQDTISSETRRFPEDSLLDLVKLIKPRASWAQWCMTTLPASGRPRPGDEELKTSLGYIARSCIQEKKKATFKKFLESTMELSIPV